MWLYSSHSRESLKIENNKTPWYTLNKTTFFTAKNTAKPQYQDHLCEPPKRVLQLGWSHNQEKIEKTFKNKCLSQKGGCNLEVIAKWGFTVQSTTNIGILI